jgi:glycogen(starch) synthase
MFKNNRARYSRMAKKANADYFFEVSWEVCNKVGGIFTVVSSKAARMMDYYNGNYCLVGPYFPEKAYGIFEEDVPPEEMHEMCEKLRQEGIVCHFGKWLIKGNPNAVLIEFTGFTKNTNDVKKQLWDDHQIDSLNTQYFDFDEPIVWATAVGKVLAGIAEVYKDKKIVAQFHEWLAGAGILHLKKNNVKIATVFTTHATMLGRTLASADVDLYNLLDQLNPEEEAKNRGITPKYQMEKQCAANAEVFTTVSEITGIEAEKLLGTKPGVILDNGLDMGKFPTFEQTSIKHHNFKIRIKDFILYYFFPFYSFDLDNTLIYFICGRYEFHDKGIDIFIKALANLNNRLKEENSERTIVAFFWVPGPIKGIKPELLENKAHYDDVKDTIQDEIDDVKHRITHSLISGKKLSDENLLSEDARENLKRKVLRLKRKNGNPPLSTHDLYEENKDPIINSFREVGLDNSEEQKVKVIFYPIYLTGADGLLDTSYYESMLGAHLGVFPSFYEPWGYTPLEGAALGVPSVTTDLSGFGKYIQGKKFGDKYPGVFVLKRFGKNDDEVTGELTETMYNFCRLSAHDRIENKMSARNIAETADWEIFAENYITAHNLALKKLK